MGFWFTYIIINLLPFLILWSHLREHTKLLKQISEQLLVIKNRRIMEAPIE